MKNKAALFQTTTNLIRAFMKLVDADSAVVYTRDGHLALEGFYRGLDDVPLATLTSDTLDEYLTMLPGDLSAVDGEGDGSGVIITLGGYAPTFDERAALDLLWADEIQHTEDVLNRIGGNVSLWYTDDRLYRVLVDGDERDDLVSALAELPPAWWVSHRTASETARVISVR